MDVPRWSDDDDAYAYAEYVAEKVTPELLHVQLVTLPNLLASMDDTAAAFADFAAAWRLSEVREVAGHPDLAELDVQIKGFYEADAA